MELLNTLISGISVGSTLCGALATLTGTNTVRAAAIGTLGGAVCGAALLTAATAAVVSTTPPVGGLLLAAIGLKALSDAAEISRDAREHDSDRR